MKLWMATCANTKLGGEKEEVKGAIRHTKLGSPLSQHIVNHKNVKLFEKRGLFQI